MKQPLAYIHPDAKIAPTVVIEPFVTIDKNVVIGEGTRIGSNVTIMEGVRIGKNCNIFPGAVIGAVPQDLKFKGEDTLAIIGDNTTIREFVTVNRGTASKGKTVVGDNCLIMAYCHIAHDCLVGNNVIMVNDSDSTRVSGLEHRTHYYYRQTKDSLLATGFENATTLMQYLTPEYRMHYPFAYGDTLYSPFEGRGEYCHQLQLHVKGYTRTSVDAVGELLLPNSEKVKQAVRVHTLRYYTQAGKDSVRMTHDTYSWYAAGIRYPVFESIKTTLSKIPPSFGEGAGGEADTTVFTTSFYYPPELQTSQVETAPLDSATTAKEWTVGDVFTEARLAPNPVTDNLYITYRLTRAAKVWFTVTTNLGTPVCQTTPQNLPEGPNQNTINMVCFKQ